VLSAVAVFVQNQLAQFTVSVAVMVSALVIIFARRPFMDSRRNVGLTYVLLVCTLQQLSALVSGLAAAIVSYIVFAGMVLYVAGLLWLLLFNTVMFRFCRPRGLYAHALSLRFLYRA
jgi:hypothetical protein